MGGRESVPSPSRIKHLSIELGSQNMLGRHRLQKSGHTFPISEYNTLKLALLPSSCCHVSSFFLSSSITYCAYPLSQNSGFQDTLPIPWLMISSTCSSPLVIRARFLSDSQQPRISLMLGSAVVSTSIQNVMPPSFVKFDPQDESHGVGMEAKTGDHAMTGRSGSRLLVSLLVSDEGG